MMKRTFSCSVSALALLSAGTVHAQAPVATADAAASASEIVVTGQRAQQARSIEEKRISLGIVDVAASDDIGQIPDKNVAEAVEHLPGVGVQYDQGEGRYVAIRGIPSTLNGYTLNGFEIGNPETNTRALPLDIMSGQLLNRVEVAKVKTADMAGQGIGGTINLVPQTAFDFKKPFVFNAEGAVGTQQIDTDGTPYKGDMTVGGRFGQDEEFGILIGGSYSDRPFTSYGFYPDDWSVDEDAARGGVPTNIKYSQYDITRERVGLSGSLDWRRGDTQLYIRGFYSRFNEHETRQRFRMDFSNIDWDANGLTGTANTTSQRSDLRLNHNAKSVLSFMGGGTTKFGDDWTLDFGLAHTRDEFDEVNRVWQFRGSPGTAEVDFTHKIYTAVPTDGYLDASGMTFYSYTDATNHASEDTWQPRFDLTGELPGIGAGNSFVKVGGNVRLTHKIYDANQSTYNRGSTSNRFTLEGLSGDNLTVDVGGASDYTIAPTIDPEAMVAYTAANLNTATMVYNANTSLSSNTLSDFDMHEDVYAGYAETNLDFGAVAITAGLRVEHTELDISGYLLDENYVVTGAQRQHNYTNVLPSLVARISPSDNTVFRLAYSRSIGRPQASELSPGGTTTADGGDLYVNTGNPDLKPYVSDAIDMIGEWYFAPGGMLSAGAFAKFIRNPIFTNSYEVSNSSYQGASYDTITYSEAMNAKSGNIVGLEASYQQQFTFLPGLLSGFGVNLNVTLTDSSLKTFDRGTVDFPEQSKLLWGAQLFYQQGPVEASIAYHHTGRALLSLGDVQIDDQYNDDLRRLDAKASVAVTDQFRVFAEAQNLTNEPTRQYQAGNRNWLTQNETYGRTVYVGASFNW